MKNTMINANAVINYTVSEEENVMKKSVISKKIAADVSICDKEENKMEKKMTTREQIQAGHNFAKQVINNSLDKRIFDFQEISLGYKYGGYTATAKKTSGGMNDLTVKYYENAKSAVTFIGGKHVTVARNTVLDRPFSDEILKLDFIGIGDNSKGAYIAEAIRDNLLQIQFIGSTDAILWIESNLYKDKNGEYVKFVDLIRVFGNTDFTVNGESIFGKKKHVKFHSVSYAEKIATIRNLPGSTFKTYGSIFVTDGGRRNSYGFLFKKNDAESVADFKVRIREDLNNLSGGLLDTIEEMLKVRGGISREKAFKLMARLSLAFTPMTKSVEFTSFAYYHGEFANSGNSDGQMTINGDKIAEYYDLKPEFVYGLGIQGRIIGGVICKGMMIPVSNEDTNVVTYVGFKKRAHVSFEEFRTMWIADTLEKGTEYIIGASDGETPFIVMDKNAMKAVVNEVEKFTLRIVSIKSRSHGYLNSQTANAMIQIDGAAEYFEEAGKASIDAEIAEIYGIYTNNCKVKNIVNPNGYLADIVSQIAPGYVATDRKLYEFLLKAKANKMFTDITKMHFALDHDDFVGYLQNDYFEMITGVRALDDNQTYVANMNGSVEMAIDRNPKTGQKEFYLAVNSSLKNVFANADDGRCKDVDARLIKVAKHMFWYADDALIILPSDSRVKNCLGGSDNDGDCGTVRMNKKFVALQCKESDGTSKIPNAPESGIMINEYTENLFENMMIDGIFGQKNNGKRIMSSTVGLSSNHNTLIQNLAVADGKLLRRVLDKVVDPNCEKLGYKKTDKKYEQHIIGNDTCVENEHVKNATIDFYNSDRSVKSFRAFIEDCKKMAPSVIGRVIDMAKTGEVVFAWYAGVLAKRDLSGKEIYGDKFQKCVCAEHLEKVLCFHKNETGISTGIEIRTSDAKEDELIIDSPLSILRDNLLNYMTEKMNDLFEKECKISDFETSLIEGGISTGSVNTADLIWAKSVHSILSFSAGLDVADKKYAMNKMAGFVRNLFDTKTESFEKLIALKSVGHNTYFPQVLREEYIVGTKMIAEGSGFETCKNVGYRAYSMDHKGRKSVEFQNGISADGSVVTENCVNGIWDVCYLGDTLYVVRTVENHFIPKADNSCAVRFKDFDSRKKVGKFNQIPDIKKLEGGFICIENENGNSAAIFSDNYRDQYQINVPRSEDKKSVLNTRYNNSIKNNGLKIGKVIQYADRTGKTITLALGSFVNRNGKALPKAKKVAKIQDFSNDVSNAFDALSANTADFDVITK